MTDLTNKHSTSFVSANEYLLRINNSVEHSIRNFGFLCPEVSFKSKDEIISSGLQLPYSEVSGWVAVYKFHNQPYYCEELSNLGSDPNVLITLRNKLTELISIEQQNAFYIIIDEQIEKLTRLRQIIDKLIYYTQEVYNSYDGDVWEILEIIRKIIFTGVSACLLQGELAQVFIISASDKETNEIKADKERFNDFNNMPLGEVEALFMQLTKSKSKNGKPFLKLDQLEQFIDRAFCSVPFTEKLSMNEKTGDKAKIVGLFHLFYAQCATHKPHIGKIDPNATVEKYIRLLTDNFDNWTYDEVVDNFRRGGNWKEPTY